MVGFEKIPGFVVEVWKNFKIVVLFGDVATGEFD